MLGFFGNQTLHFFFYHHTREGLVYNAFRNDFRSDSLIGLESSSPCVVEQRDDILLPAAALGGMVHTPLFPQQDKTGGGEISCWMGRAGVQGRMKGRRMLKLSLPPCAVVFTTVCISLYKPALCLCSDSYSRAWGWGKQRSPRLPGWVKMMLSHRMGSECHCV